LKNRNIEVVTHKSDLNAKNKTIKVKEKEVYKLEKKVEDLAGNVKKLKVEISSSKQEIKKLVNQQRPKTKKSQSVSTNTVSISALFSETTSKCCLNNTSTTKKVCSPSRDTAYSHSDRLISLGLVLESLSSSDFSLTSSMVAHWTPLVYDSFQNPSSLSSMVTHCAKLPPPGDKYLTMEDSEILTEMKKWIEEYWKK
jgi:hypothetical protein